MIYKQNYTPKAGENCILESIGLTAYRKEIVIDYITDEVGCFTDVKLKKQFTFATDQTVFLPIPTKADVERKKLVDILCVTADYVLVDVAKEIQKAGFTIPKKVKRSEIADVVANTSPMISVEDLVDEICNLLGDLVEDGAND